MFAPGAPLARAVSRARESLSQTREAVADEIQTAESLMNEATRTPEQAAEAGEELPEDLDASEAEERLDEEYRPLMDDADGDEHRAEGGSRSQNQRKREGRKTPNGAGGADAEGGTKKMRKLEVWLAQGIFFVLGACILLAWNTEIVAGSYFSARLVDSPFQFSYSSFVALTFTTGNLVFLAHANATQQGADLARRISLSITVLACVLIIFIVTTQVEQIPQNLFFAFLIISSIVLSASASYLQNAVVALSAAFGPSYLASILSGQGGIGFAVAMIQFVSAYSAAKASASADPPAFTSLLLQTDVSLVSTSDLGHPSGDLGIYMFDAPVPPEATRQSAFSFFLTIGIFAAVSWVSYAVLIRLPLYRLVIRSTFDEDASSRSNSKPSPSPSTSMRKVERKVRKLGIAMFLVFGITLSVFPSITSSILSVKTGEPDANIFQKPELFVPLGFAVFAAGDWFGRVLPQWEKLAWTNWKGLMACSVARVVFVPLFLMCNQQAGGGDAVIRSDWLYILIMFIFATSNGYISTLIMLASVVEPSLDEDEVDIAATCLAFYLTAGLASGSLVSFAVRGAVCGCNPFTSPS
ncbi:hypothetical protein JCM5296_005511 [Sporobolomyces johnsonii]